MCIRDSVRSGREGDRWLDGQSCAVRFGDCRIGGQREQRRVTPRVVESRDLDTGAEPIGRQFPALKRNADARVLFDEIVVVTEAESGGDAMVPSTHRNIECAGPALLRVIDEFRSRRRERNPPRALLLAELEDDLDAVSYT